MGKFKLLQYSFFTYTLVCTDFVFSLIGVVTFTLFAILRFKVHNTSNTVQIQSSLNEHTRTHKSNSDTCHSQLFICYETSLFLNHTFQSSEGFYKQHVRHSVTKAVLQHATARQTTVKNAFVGRIKCLFIFSLC